MRVNTFHGDPRPSLWSWRAPCLSHRKVRLIAPSGSENERVLMLLLSTNLTKVCMALHVPEQTGVLELLPSYTDGCLLTIVHLIDNRLATLSKF